MPGGNGRHEDREDMVVHSYRSREAELTRAHNRDASVRPLEALQHRDRCIRLGVDHSHNGPGAAVLDHSTGLGWEEGDPDRERCTAGEHRMAAAEDIARADMVEERNWGGSCWRTSGPVQGRVEEHGHAREAIGVVVADSFQREDERLRREEDCGRDRVGRCTRNAPVASRGSRHDLLGSVLRDRGRDASLRLDPDHEEDTMEPDGRNLGVLPTPPQGEEVAEDRIRMPT